MTEGPSDIDNVFEDATPTPVQTPATDRALRILVVEDDPKESRYLQAALDDLCPGPHEVVTVKGMSEARRLLLEGVADAVAINLFAPADVEVMDTPFVEDTAPERPFLMLPGLDETEGGAQPEGAAALIRTPWFQKLLKQSLQAKRLQEQVAVAREEAIELRRRLEEREGLFEAAIRVAHGGLWYCDLAAGNFWFSPRWKALLGFEDEEIADTENEWYSRVHPDDLPGLREEMNSLLRGGSVTVEALHRVRHKTGVWRWMLCRALIDSGGDDRPLRVVGSLSDVTDHNETRERLEYGNFYDALTGLPNRTLFMDRLQHAFEKSARRAEHRFAVFVADLDHFSLVNDGIGAHAGDELLQIIGRRLRDCVRPGDTVSRLSADEFGILLDGVRDEDTVSRVLERVQSSLSDPTRVEGEDIIISASVGIAFPAAAHKRPADLLRDAYLAVRRAKSRGKGRYEVFDTQLHERTVTRLKLETDLRRAVDREEFTLHYQPILDLETGEAAGFEALLRWLHPQRGLISPADFLPVLEETELIIPVTHWILQEAGTALGAWKRDGTLRDNACMNVNLSGRQFRYRSIVYEIRAILQQAGIPAEHIKLEITEGTLLQDSSFLGAAFEQLRALGLEFCIDDFGTGYSSFSYLCKFPVGTLKIDKSFIDRIDKNDNSFEVVRTIADMSASLGMTIVAEGIERYEQVRLLRAMGCQYGQGYYFSKPIPGADVRTWLLTRAKAPSDAIFTRADVRLN